MKQIDRRKFISAVGLAGMAGLTPLPSFALQTPKAANAGTLVKTGPYLQSPLPGKMTVRWITHEPCFSWVEYGESASQLTQKATGVSEFGLVEAYNTVHAITLT